MYICKEMQSLDYREKMSDEMVTELTEEKFDFDDTKFSDAILQYYHWDTQNYTFMNLMTGKEGPAIEDVIRNRPFVSLDHHLELEGQSLDELLEQYNNALYVQESKIADCVTFIRCKMEKCGSTYKWIENTDKKREFVSKKYVIPQSPKMSYQKTFDICGQCIWESGRVKENACVGAMMTLLKYFGGIVEMRNIASNEKKVFSFKHVVEIESMMINMNKEQDNFWNNFFVGARCTKLHTIKFDGVPDEADKMIDRFKNHYLYDVDFMIYSLHYESNINRISILQRPADDVNNDGVVMRTFVAVCEYAYPFEKSSYHFVETERLWFGKTIDYADKMIERGGIILWRDSLENTKMAYVSKIIDDAVGAVKDGIKKGYSLNEMMDDWEVKNGLKIYNVAAYAFYLSEIPVAEKLMKIFDEKYKRKFVNSMSIYSLQRFNESLERHLGTINYREKALNKMLGIPKGFIKSVMNKNMPISTIGDTKRLFGEENKNYLMSMNKQDYEFLLDKVPVVGWGSERIRQMIVLFGHENWKGYAYFFERLSNADSCLYGEYLSMLIDIKNLGYDSEECKDKVIANAEWKLSGENLKKSVNSITAAHYIMTNKAEYDYAKKRFNRLQDFWETFSFSWNGYFICWPKSPVDLVIEGQCLNHCVKTFISDVADEQTIILFARKESCPDKPFYTIEVIGEEYCLRQVHGVNNESMGKADRGFKEFISRFCAAKEIDMTAYDYDEAVANPTAFQEDDDYYDDDEYWEDEEEYDDE